MRVDVLSIFPEYLAPLDLSLVGRARREGLVDVRVHDLRTWTTDRHRTVDDTPVGGGAGMVMRADVWGTALDEVLDAPLENPAARRVLLVPTPSGLPLTQRDVERWAAEADQLVLACGRYEGIDGRVVEEYRTRARAEASAQEAGAAEGTPAAPALEVREFSLGDYVLNGGEVAALVVVEGVARLLPGVVGNPQSLVEESHGAAGLLEYPVFTRPVSWRGQEVDPALLSGDHARIARWRRDRALERTAERRPDMIEALDPSVLDAPDRAALARLGWLAAPGAAPRPLVLEEARPADAPALARLAAATFPLACPPGLPRAAIDEFLTTHLSATAFEGYLEDPRRHVVLVARTGQDADPVGYTLALRPAHAQDVPAEGEVADLLPARPAAYLSKMYVREDLRGSGLAAALLEETFVRATTPTVQDGTWPAAVGMCLGTNAGNRAALRFYRRHEFSVVGRRRFVVGGQEQDDRVLWRPVAD